jgi:hypothetical protein
VVVGEIDNIDDLMKYVDSVFSSNDGLEFGIYDKLQFNYDF